MNNPYQAPNTEVPQNTTSNTTERTLPAQPITLDPTWCISRGWKLTCQNFGALFLIITLPLIINYIISSILQRISLKVDGFTTFQFGSYSIPQQVYGPTSIALAIISSLISVWIMIGVIKATIDFLDGKNPSIGTVFNQGSRIVKALLAYIIFGLAVSIGLVFLIFPGLYIATTYGFCFHAIADKDLGVFESFEYSKKLTQGNKLNVFVLGILALLACIAGTLAILVGLLWALPVVALASTIAYCALHHGKSVALNQL